MKTKTLAINNLAIRAAAIIVLLGFAVFSMI